MTTNKYTYCYVVSNPSFDDDVYKIGRAGNLKQRLKALNNTSVPTPFELVLSFRGRHKHITHLETILHKHFRKQRLNRKREFFKLTDEDLDTIKDIAGRYGYTCVFDESKDTLVHIYEDEELTVDRLYDICEKKGLLEDWMENLSEFTYWYENFKISLRETEEYNQRCEYENYMWKEEGYIPSEDYENPRYYEDAIDFIGGNIGGSEELMYFIMDCQPELYWCIQECSYP